MRHYIPSALAASALALTVLASTAMAQQPQGVRIRGTIEKVDGNVLTVKAREGDEKIVKLPDDVRVTGIARIAMSEIKPGSYIGVSGMPKADGKQQALAIHIFMESQRGAGEGFQPWDLKPGSSMTNATVADRVTATSGETITVKYKGGEKTIDVTPETPIVTFLPGEKSELKPGAKVIIFGAVQGADGKFDAGRLGVGRDGITPPM
ncbi:MAG: hypothetical protein JWQ51_2857 [Tardiphaga sp.]|jgi:hypothetical protein|nr:hypothetical protein [Tardiphaga sp.]MDB5630517.1 hypothetical protein [Tardiphaga sp.]